MTHYEDDLLSDWLAEGPQHGSPAAIDEVLARAGATRQRPGWMVALTGGTIADTPGSSLLRYAVVALTLIALVGLLAGAMIAGGIVSPNPRPLVVADDSPSPAPIARAELPAAGAVEPGRYFFANPYADENPIRDCDDGCSDYRQIVFTLPAGWESRGALVAKHLNQANEVAFSIWTVDSVYADPCHWQSSALAPMTFAHRHEDGGFVLEDAPWLQNLETRLASAPEEVQLGEVVETTIRIELRVPAELDIRTCDLGEYRAWTEKDVADGANAHHAAGQVDEVYIVDVDRSPLVIDASHRPGSSPADVAELEQILASIEVDR
jgi:hypothetical protein